MRISEDAAVQKILKAVADPENARILVRLRSKEKSAQDVSGETGIPLSTVYRKLDELRESGLVMIARFSVTSGKKVEFLAPTFSELRISMGEDQIRVDIVPSDETANIRWLDLFRGK